MVRPKPLIIIIAISTALATPALAQWQSQEPASFQAQYPNGDPSFTTPAVPDAMARTPSARSPRPTGIRKTKGK
jgi:hypothetical protein